VMGLIRDRCVLCKREKEVIKNLRHLVESGNGLCLIGRYFEINECEINFIVYKKFSCYPTKLYIMCCVDTDTDDEMYTTGMFGFSYSAFTC